MFKLNKNVLGAWDSRKMFYLSTTGPVFTNHSQEYSLSFSPTLYEFEFTQLLIG